MTDRKLENIILVFVDGLGIGAETEFNPCANPDIELLRLFNDRTYPARIHPMGHATGLDATMNVPGLPQSATGQTALFTGMNVARQQGAHLGPFPNADLRALISRNSLFSTFTDRGWSTRFINTYTPQYFHVNPYDMIDRLSVTSVLTLYAGLPFMSFDDMLAENSVYHDITNEKLIERGHNVPARSPEESGRILARTATRNRLSLFEFFLTDHAGHSGDIDWAVREIKKLDIFLSSLIDNTDLERTLILVTSDHGNVEDISFRGHNLNPTMTLLFWQHASTLLPHLKSITDVTPLLVKLGEENFS